VLGPDFLDADPLDDEVLRRELVQPDSLWREVEVVSETGSTNADLAARAREGAGSGTVLVTGYQSAGRGRQGRTWSAPPGANVAMSVLLEPQAAPVARWTWLPLLAGLAVVEGLRALRLGATGELPAVLKWPNDVLVEGGKICGILAERVETPSGPACVVGMGINVHLRLDQLPVPTATSLALLCGTDVPRRNDVVVTVLRALDRVYRGWDTGDDDDAFAAAYAQRCDTLGREVKVLLAGQRSLEGVAEAIDGQGRLVVRTAAGREVLGAGDVIHVR
jgi:BirA family biotin operon repressor/biotin-[acetyl-CoA-carboxylase] ligase